MPKSSPILAFPDTHVSKIKKHFSDCDSVIWMYLGKDFLAMRTMSQELGDRFHHIDISKLHNEVANDIRKEHVQWIDALNNIYGDTLEWWLGSVSSRNIYTSNLFQYSCYLEIMERLWTGEKSIPHLIVIESPGLMKAIQKWAAGRDIAIKVIYYYKAWQKAFTYYMKFFLELGKFVIISALRWIAASLSAREFKIKNFEVGPTVIVDTFIHDYCLSDDGTFTDRYFPHLHEYLNEKKLHVIVHPVLHGFRFNYLSIYYRMRRSNTHFIIQEDFLHFSDYLSALAFPAKTLLQKVSAPQFRSFDLSDILREDQENQAFSDGMRAVLLYRLFLRLGETELYPRQIISWYENQIIDKALISGIRKAFPNAKIIGAQQFLHAPNILNLFPIQSEVEAGITPDIVLTTSQHQCQIVQSFTNNISCRPAAALRYAHVFYNESTANCTTAKKERIILVILPFNITEAVELLETMAGILNRIRVDFRILIKGHPDYRPEDMKSRFGEGYWPMRFEIFQGNIREGLDCASVVISSTSSSMVEAAARGIPVIFVGRQMVLNQNILQTIGIGLEFVSECLSDRELIEAIDKYIDLSVDKIEEYIKIGEKVRDLFFTPVNEQTMWPFLAINGENYVP